MKLSLPVINTIRFDTDLKIIANRPGVKTQVETTGYCLDGLLENGESGLAVGIRIRISFYVDKLENEVAGYLSETESTVLIHTSALKDLSMLNKFANDVFINIKRNLQRELPLFDLSGLEFSDPNKMGYYLSEGLIQKGLYK